MSTTTPNSPAPPTGAGPSRDAGLDVLRTVAVLLVFAQHQMSLLGLDTYVPALDASVGRICVALFVALSGALAATSRAPTAGAWLAKRLRRVYPAYWIVMSAALLGAAATGYKSFGVGQAVSQLLGLGMFTHHGRLVHVATWFVSLILLLYAVTAVAKWVAGGRPGAERAAIAAALAINNAIAWVGLEVDLTAHVATYFVAYLAFTAPPPARRAWLLGAAVAMGALSLSWERLVCGSLAIGAIGLLVGVRSPGRVFSVFARFSYEFYLVSGPVLVLVDRACGDRPWAATPTALLLSVGAAWLLYEAVERLTPAKGRRSNTEATGPRAAHNRQGGEPVQNRL